MNHLPRKPLALDRPRVPWSMETTTGDRSWTHIPSRSEQAYRHIARLISSGMLRAGDELPGERLLGRVFDIARGSLRMALDLLKRDGMVRIAHGKSTIVTGEPLPRGTPFSLTTCTSPVPEAQCVVERARRLASTVVIDPELCKADPRRVGVLAEMQHSARDLPQFVIVDRQFHAELQASCDARELAPLLHLANVLTHSALRDAFEAQTVRSEIAKQHRAIAHALQRRDICAAVVALCDQLEMRITAHPAST
jgi:DNA-binding FadR family transcriptional regulator